MTISSSEIFAERTTVIKRNTKGIPFFQVKEKGDAFIVRRKSKKNVDKTSLKSGQENPIMREKHRI
jgi:hypothetical protein